MRETCLHDWVRLVALLMLMRCARGLCGHGFASNLRKRRHAAEAHAAQQVQAMSWQWRGSSLLRIGDHDLHLQRMWLHRHRGCAGELLDLQRRYLPLQRG